MLAKYRFHWSKMNPFVELGPSFRTAGNLNGTNPSHYGFTSGLGVEMHLRQPQRRAHVAIHALGRGRRRASATK